MAYQIFRYKLSNGEKKAGQSDPIYGTKQSYTGNGRGRNLVVLRSTEQSSTKEGEKNEDDKQTSTD